ncbi:hypothetical protein DXG01_004188 [Tephrocybe rancida]|nr:hypothetical protein DXG01_004188 [Tephrocybe rancida]
MSQLYDDSNPHHRSFDHVGHRRFSLNYFQPASRIKKPRMSFEPSAECDPRTMADLPVYRLKYHREDLASKGRYLIRTNNLERRIFNEEDSLIRLLEMKHRVELAESSPPTAIVSHALCDDLSCLIYGLGRQLSRRSRGRSRGVQASALLSLLRHGQATELDNLKVEVQRCEHLHMAASVRRAEAELEYLQDELGTIPEYNSFEDCLAYQKNAEEWSSNAFQIASSPS